jgi:hypothetical protein
VNDPIIGVGPTAELNLRVSVATLSRVVFPHPADGIPMLALEHKASLSSRDTEALLDVKAQPFGGAIRILYPNRLFTLVGGFNFDSVRSRSEGDFRIYIRPACWENVRDFCLQNRAEEDDPDLEIDPTRELVEEFEDALGIKLQADHYDVKPIGIVVENEPARTTNLRAAGAPTARIYRVYEVQILDSGLCQSMITNSEANPSRVLQRLALNDARKGGRGRANAILAAAEDGIRAAYLAIPPEIRGQPLPFADTVLEGNVAAVLEGVQVTKYRHIRQ